jgi:hypothetical protein
MNRKPRIAHAVKLETGIAHFSQPIMILQARMAVPSRLLNESLVRRGGAVHGSPAG